MSDNIFTIFLPASVTSLIQPMEQGIRRDFMRHFISPPIALQGFHSRYSMNNTIFNVACAWNAVPSQVFRQAWRKLWPAGAFNEGSSEEEEEEVAARHCTAKPHHKTLAHILELVKEGPSCPGSQLQNIGPGEQGTAGREMGETHTAMSLAQADDHAGEGKQGTEEDDEVAWEQAAASFEAIVHFAERQPCFTVQQVGQLHQLHFAFRRQWQLKQQQVALRAVVKIEALQECPAGGTAPSHSPLPCSSTAGDH